jgi:hypothetical protein
MVNHPLPQDNPKMPFIENDEGAAASGIGRSVIGVGRVQRQHV